MLGDDKAEARLAELVQNDDRHLRKRARAALEQIERQRAQVEAGEGKQHPRREG